MTLLIPKSPNANSLGAALLKALGDPAYRAGNAQEKFERIEVLLNAVEARVIAIDNFQDIPARRRIRGISEIGDWFRDLCSMKFPGVILAFGTEEAAIVRDSSTQLRRRMQARFELPVFSIETPTDVKRWKWLLGEIDLRLPMAEDSNLNESKMAVRIAVACGGNFDYLMKLLEKAMMSAVNRGSERIEMEDLLKGFDTQHQVSAEGGNPFKEDFTSTRLNLPGQIFHNPSEDDDSSRAKDRPASNRNATKRT